MSQSRWFLDNSDDKDKVQLFDTAFPQEFRSATSGEFRVVNTTGKMDTTIINQEDLKYSRQHRTKIKRISLDR